ncbi:E3 SUMO-protein ligase KIAA1586-like [Physella acuta]|uniref:E3 SUMO-protein ligase KIAA1586-like n=1 Tax=Physella acuta TaxID=109671 RepID=UPI0027DBEA15|nr:E3 SUMO-protein ligase KIAA1586-like [Physella acuta]
MGKYVSIPDSWRSKNYAFEFVEAINKVVVKNILTELRVASFHTLIVDESTDITVHKMLILYFKFRPVNSLLYKTVFGGIIQLTACDASALEAAITQYYTEHQLDMNRMVMITSDGASVMLGRRKGLAALLKAKVPHLVEQHCVAHREDLALSDAWKDVNLFKNIEVLLRTVYTLFSRSSVKKGALEELANVHDMDVISFRPIHEVRWLSRHFAVSAFVRNLDVLAAYCEEQVQDCNDPVCCYILKSLRDPLYQVALYTVNDVLTELANLSMLLQRSNLSSIEAHQFCISKIRKLEAQYLSEDVYWNDKAKKILNENVGIDTRQITQFIRSVWDHLNVRFPGDELQFWSAFDHTGLKNCAFEFGVKEIKELCGKYKDVLQTTNEESIITQYNDFKFQISEKLKSGSHPALIASEVLAL